MQQITPCLWFNNNAENAMALSCSVFEHSRIVQIERYPDESLDAHFVGRSGKVISGLFELGRQRFLCLDGGPTFVCNPSISFYCTFHERADMEAAWSKLIDGGEALMALQAYPWSPLYGWCKDQYGVTWQLSLSAPTTSEGITPLLMFTNAQAGKARDAMQLYTALFDHSGIDAIATYEAGEGDTPGLIKHARFHLGDDPLMAMDSSYPHQFDFNEAISFQISCKDQAEIDHFWGALTANGGQESQCGWCKDPFGVSWQIIPKQMGALLGTGPAAIKAMMQMQKIDIATLEKSGKEAQ